MGLFKNNNDIRSDAARRPDGINGRRRPASTSPDQPRRGAPGTMFSYYSQRSDARQNTGRRDTIELDSAERPSGIFAMPAKRRVLVVVGGLAALLLFGYLSTLSTEPRVVLLQNKASSHFLQSGDVYAQAAEVVLEQSILNRGKLSIDSAAVRDTLIRNYPEIKSVTLTTPLFSRQPQVYIEPYKPSFVLTTVDGNSFLLDTTGRALANTSQISGLDELGVPTLRDKTGHVVKIGVRAIPSSTVTFVQTVLAALKAQGISYSTLTLPAGSYELDLGVAGKPYIVKFNLMNDPLQQAGTLLALQGRLATDKATPGQYIDVRVPERAYYK